MSKGILITLVVALTVVIIGYVFLKAEHLEGADTLAIAMSAIIGVFVGIQNSMIARDLEKVKNQTNGMTHHIMEENKLLRQVVEPARKVADIREIQNGRTEDSGSGTGRSRRDRTVSDGHRVSDRDSHRSTGPTEGSVPKRNRKR